MLKQSNYYKSEGWHIISMYAFQVSNFSILCNVHVYFVTQPQFTSQLYNIDNI